MKDMRLLTALIANLRAENSKVDVKESWMVYYIDTKREWCSSSD